MAAAHFTLLLLSFEIHYNCLMQRQAGTMEQEKERSDSSDKNTSDKGVHKCMIYGEGASLVCHLAAKTRRLKPLLARFANL